jgi:UDP-N-acetylmuramate dehydrogenase
MSADDRSLRSILSEDDREALRSVVGERVRFDEPLAPYTSWKIGGPADAFVVLHDERELEAVLRMIARRRLPFFVLGAGSNVLVGDGGVRGLVLRLEGAFARIDVATRDDAVEIEAGGCAGMATLVARAAGAGAEGADALAGIPGTVGGSVRMNAGTDRELGEFVRDVRVQTPGNPRPHVVDIRYFYRKSTLPRDAVVASARFVFARGDENEVRRRVRERLLRRKQTQPISLPNAGSCFRNPPGDKAARLIEAVGAKGWSEGDARISEHHANFIVHQGQARAYDVARLLVRVRRAVRERFGVELEPEVHFVGVFADPVMTGDERAAG